MPAGKVQDHSEVKRWYEEGITYREMQERYLEKYNIETSIAMWSAYSRRHGFKPRYAWNEDLIPWRVKPEHWQLGAYIMLSQEARRRAGLPVSKIRMERLEAWKAKLEEADRVVHYDPDLPENPFRLVPRRHGIDTDLVRVPEKATRLAAAER